MAYYDPVGRECTYSDAFAGGRLKPGYRSTVGDGESIRFDFALMDKASVFLTDNAAASQHSPSDSWVQTKLDNQQAAHDAKFAFMGTSAPVFDRATAELVLRANQQAAPNRMVRDMAAAAQYDGCLPVGSTSGSASARAPTTTNDSGAAVRDLARASQYL